jgi:hypothetical protein
MAIGFPVGKYGPLARPPVSEITFEEARVALAGA